MIKRHIVVHMTVDDTADGGMHAVLHPQTYRWSAGENELFHQRRCTSRKGRVAWGEAYWRQLIWVTNDEDALQAASAESVGDRAHGVCLAHLLTLVHDQADGLGVPAQIRATSSRCGREDALAQKACTFVATCAGCR